MQTQAFHFSGQPAQRAREILAAATGLIDGERDLIANLANTAALLGMALPDINWAGFYIRRGDVLVLGPFWGKPACIRIAWDAGVCGKAMATGCSQLVPDVHAFPGHIACDSASNAELVAPIRLPGGAVAGVLDIDSPVFGRFTEEDRQLAEALAAMLAAGCDWPAANR